MQKLIDAQTLVRKTCGKSFAGEIRYITGLKEHCFDIYIGRMQPARKQWLEEVIGQDPELQTIRFSDRWAISEKKPTPKGAGYYHPTNRDRDKPEFANPSMVRLIKHTGSDRWNRVIVLGMNYVGTDKHAGIDASHDPVVIADWEWWCLQSDFITATKIGKVETLTEYLVMPSEHQNWWGYEQA